MLAKGLAILSFLYLTGCATTTQKAGMTSPEVSKPKTEEKQSMAPVRKDCIPFADSLADLPAFVQGKSVIITEFLKSCTLETGKSGYLKGSSWTAMGFPCTGGGGDVEWKGSLYMPKLVTFNFSNSCPMAPSDQRLVETDLRGEVEIPLDSKLIAYYPFSVVYWEVDGFRDADVGFKVELFSGPARKTAWADFQARKPVKVRLFGRENALVKTKHFYKVDGAIQKIGEETLEFIFKVENVKVLSKEEVADVKKRCQGLKPRRNCNQLFNI